MLRFLAALLFVLAATPAPARDFTVSATRAWIVLKGQMFSANGDFLFRRYSVFRTDPMLRNTMILVCPIQEPTNAIHATFVLPKEVLPIPGTTAKTWKPDFQVRVLITKDGRSSSFLTTAEYIKGELFIDRTPDNEDMFDRMLEADEIAFPIGPKGTIATYQFVAKEGDEFLIRTMRNNSNATIETTFEGPEGIAACLHLRERAKRN